MINKHILIVDDEISILTVLKNSLVKTGLNYQIDTVTSGFAALGKLRFKSYSLIVTDYKMVGMDGLEFLKTIRVLQPNALVILMTGHGSDALKAEAQRLLVYRYLTKPIEIDLFRNIVQEALVGVGANPRLVRMLSSDQFAKSQALMKQLKIEVGARCVFMTDLSGQIFTQIGDMELPHLEEITTLLSSSIAALLEASNILTDNSKIKGIVYFKTETNSLCALNIGRQMFLVLVSESELVATSIGLIWHFAHRVADILDQIMEKANFVPLHKLLNENLKKDFDDELEKLIITPQPSGRMRSEGELLGSEGEQLQSKIKKNIINTTLKNYQEAVKVGLVPNDAGAKTEKR